MFKRSPQPPPKGKKTLKQIEAELEARGNAADLDDQPTSMSISEGGSTAPWEVVPSDDVPIRYSQNVTNIGLIFFTYQLYAVFQK